MARCLVILVAFLALQATSDAALTLSPQAWFQQLVDQANTLRQQIDDTIASVEENIVNNTDAIVTKIHDNIETVANNVRTEVDSVVSKFVAAGKNVVECSEKVPSEVNELVSNITTSAMNCVASEVKDGKSLVKDLIDRGEELNKTIGDLQTQMTDCNSKGLGSVVCDIEVLTTAASTISSDSMAIFGDITQAVALVSGFQMNVNSCETAVFTSVPTQTQALLSKVTGCYTGQ